MQLSPILCEQVHAPVSLLDGQDLTISVTRVVFEQTRACEEPPTVIAGTVVGGVVTFSSFV